MISDRCFAPFANESQVVTIGRLMVENRLDRVTLSGDVDITADQAGLAMAKDVHALLAAIVHRLEAQPLPRALPPPTVTTVANPFGG